MLTPALEQVAMEKFIRPTVAALAARGVPYMGVLYLGLMITKDGPKLVEYNCRFGDPECQVLVPRLRSDLLTALLAARDGALSALDVRWRDEAALTVVMASKGYPGTPTKRPGDFRAGRGGEDCRASPSSMPAQNGARTRSLPMADGC